MGKQDVPVFLGQLMGMTMQPLDCFLEQTNHRATTVERLQAKFKELASRYKTLIQPGSRIPERSSYALYTQWITVLLKKTLSHMAWE